MTKKKVKKFTPNTACTKEPKEICAPAGCGFKEVGTANDEKIQQKVGTANDEKRQQEVGTATDETTRGRNCH